MLGEGHKSVISRNRYYYYYYYCKQGLLSMSHIMLKHKNKVRCREKKREEAVLNLYFTRNRVTFFMYSLCVRPVLELQNKFKLSFLFTIRHLVASQSISWVKYQLYKVEGLALFFIDRIYICMGRRVARNPSSGLFSYTELGQNRV